MGRRRRLAPLSAVLLAFAVSACGSTSSSSSASSSTATRSATSSSSSAAASPTTSTAQASPALGYEGIPLEPGTAVGSAATTSTRAVAGIQCGSTEQLAYHIHAHLAVYVNGQLRSLPPGIGIPGSVVQQTAQGPVAAGGHCIYWLHTHTADGVIHIESPSQRIYTLGDFFDEWHQPLTPARVGDARGLVTAFLNGKRWTRSLRAIPLLPHAQIQLDIGRPVAPLLHVSWTGTGL